MAANEENIFIENLIALVTENRCIYDRKDALYFNNQVRANIWQEISEKLGKSVIECKNRWKLLREKFTKEMKKIDTASSSGKRNESEWIHLEKMAFLVDMKQIRPRTKFLFAIKNDSQPELDDQQTQSSLNNRTREKFVSNNTKNTKDDYMRRRIDEYMRKRIDEYMEKRFDALYDRIASKIEKFENEEENSDKLFMKTVVSFMKDLPTSVKDDFQREMFCRVMELRNEQF